MATGLETFTAAVKLAELAVSTITLLHRVFVMAPLEAETLSSTTSEMASIADLVSELIKHRIQIRGGSPRSSLEIAMYNAIRQSLEQCRRCLDYLKTQLRPFENVPPDRIDRLARNYHFIRSGQFRQEQENMLQRRTYGLSLIVNLLNNHDISELRLRQVQTVLTDNDETPADGAIVVEPQDCPAPETVDTSDTPGLDEWPNTPLIDAIERDDELGVNQCIEAGASVRCLGPEQGTLFHLAAAKNSYRALRALLQSREAQDPHILDATDSRNRTVLRLIAKDADRDLSIDAAKILLELGSNPALTDNLDRSAMYWAVDGCTEPNRVGFVRMLHFHPSGLSLETIKDRYGRKYEEFRKLVDPNLPRAGPQRRNTTWDIWNVRQFRRQVRRESI